jgi:hypothetical protein
VKSKKKTQTNDAPTLDWLSSLAHQLDTVIEEDPKRRSAGTLVVRALIREALKGDVRAIKECLRLADQTKRPEAEFEPHDPAPSTDRRKRGRPRTQVDLASVRELAREGMWNATQIARVLRVTRQEPVHPSRLPEVKEAIEDGKALWARDYLQRFNDMVRKRRFDAAILYATKQGPIGWSDRQGLTASDGSAIPLEIAGAAERLIDAVLRYQQAKKERDGQ